MSALPALAPSRGAPTLTLLRDAELLNQPFHDVSACTGEAKWAETAAPCSPRVSTSLTRYSVGNDGDQKALAPHLHALVRVLHTHDHPLHLRANAGGKGGEGSNSDRAHSPPPPQVPTSPRRDNRLAVKAGTPATQCCHYELPVISRVCSPPPSPAAFHAPSPPQTLCPQAEGPPC